MKRLLAVMTITLSGCSTVPHSNPVREATHPARPQISADSAMDLQRMEALLQRIRFLERKLASLSTGGPDVAAYSYNELPPLPRYHQPVAKKRAVARPARKSVAKPASKPVLPKPMARPQARAMTVAYRPPTEIKRIQVAPAAPVEAPSLTSIPAAPETQWDLLYRYSDNYAAIAMVSRLSQTGIPIRRDYVAGEYVIFVGSYRDESAARVRRVFLHERTGTAPELRVRAIDG